ncbi:MAG TPA: PD-(D/E)XK nuclease family protein, partial [Clostridia bacterium]|nr:PD-(D/E)XK nuclease family protein [Clostridia bacterium]
MGNKPVIQVQVRELVEFALRKGDLGGARDFVGPQRALAGIRGHQKIQRSRPEGYEKEVPVTRDIERPGFILRVQGRIDGLVASSDPVLIEEIKTVQNGWDGQADPLHWAQARIYGFIYGHDHGLQRVKLQLTYLDLDTERATELFEEPGFEELRRFFEQAAGIYLQWVEEWQQWRATRDASIRAVPFPFGTYRAGQRELAVAAYRALVRGDR